MSKTVRPFSSHKAREDIVNSLDVAVRVICYYILAARQEVWVFFRCVLFLLCNG